MVVPQNEREYRLTRKFSDDTFSLITLKFDNMIRKVLYKFKAILILINIKSHNCWFPFEDHS